jgi:DnaK suppressor protein
VDAEKLREYEGMLLELQAEIQAEIEHPSGEAAPVKVDPVMGRISRGDAMQVQQLALEVKRRREERLIRIQVALQRIQEASYGQCGRCRGPIGDARLNAFPDVVLCVSCKSAASR